MLQATIHPAGETPGVESAAAKIISATEGCHLPGAAAFRPATAPRAANANNPANATAAHIATAGSGVSIPPANRRAASKIAAVQSAAPQTGAMSVVNRSDKEAPIGRAGFAISR